MFCLLTSSIFAVPTNIAGSAAEIGQDLRFAFLSSNISTSFYNLFNFSFLKLRTSTNPTPVVSIQVFPGSVTIQQGEKATFSAIGFDADGEPVNGLNHDWEPFIRHRLLTHREIKSRSPTAFGSGYKIGDVYSATVPFAFGLRIGGRHLGFGK